MGKWFFHKSRLVKFHGKYWIIPCVSIWIDKYSFLETGVESPAVGFQISFLNFAFGFTIQRGY